MHNATFYGTGVALVTPFNDDETIDFAALGKLIDHVINGGVNYVVTLGTTGETPTLSKEEKKAVANYTIERVAARVPVVIGIGGNSTQDVLDAMQYLPLDKCDAMLSVSPYYNKPSQEGILQHYRKIAAATNKPIILYNVPGRTGRSMVAATTLALAQEFKNIIAVKEASGDLAQCMKLIAGAPEHFMVISGDDDLVLPQLACGIKGVISVAANFFAAEFSQMVQNGLEGKYDDARKWHYKMLPAIELMFAENNPAGIKAFLATKHICKNTFRLPVVPVSATTQHAIEQFVKNYS
jgi:4-hydroxy-tetrahydrodipicolinate synthase